MKKIIIFIMSFFFMTISCKKKQIETNQDIKVIKSQNTKYKKKKIDSLNFKLKLYHQFEKNIENEYKINPDSTIMIYNQILKQNSNSALNELIQERIKKINQNKKYWNKIDGWKISKDGILINPKTDIGKISCQ
jgi:hypothetical protein